MPITMQVMRPVPEDESGLFVTGPQGYEESLPLGTVSHQESDDVSALSPITHNNDQGSGSASTKRSLVADFLEGDSSTGETRKRLYGRTVQVTELRDAFKRVCGSHDTAETGLSESIFVSGESGTGTSTLVDEGLRDYAVQTKQAFCVSGNFYHSMHSTTPYAALVESFTDLVDLIVQSGDEKVEAVRAAMKDGLGAYGGLLARVVPNLALITRENYETGENVEQLQLQGVRAFVLFKRLCRSFLSASTASGHPIVLFIDDLQWADKPSIDIIESLISDDESRGILIVCGFRSERVNRNLKSLLDSVGSTATRIEVGNLGFDDVNELISDMMGDADRRSTFELSAVVMKRTLGNPQFVFKFLEQMESRRLIKFSTRLSNWTWDVVKLEKSTSVTDNVVALLEDKLSVMPNDLKDVLMVCAHIGYTFEVRLLEELLAVTQIASLGRMISKILAKAESQGFVESTDSGFRFTHDRVHSKLHSLAASEEEHANLSFQIGQIVWERAKQATVLNENEIFEAVYHLNLSHQLVTDREHRIEVADLNLIAAKLAMGKSAYSDAEKYMAHARNLVDPSIWKANYDFALKLYTLSAQVMYATGELDATSLMLDEIFLHCQDARDLFRAYDIKINMLSSQGRHMEAIAVGFELLNLLGEKFPKRPTKVTVVRKLCKTKLMLRGKTHVDVEALPFCDSEAHRDALKVLSTIATISYGKTISAVPFCLVTFRMMKLSLTCGLSTWSVHGIACYATVLSLLGFYKEAYRYGSMAMNLLESPSLDCREVEARTTLALAIFVMHWREPLSATACLEAHNVGMAWGDLDTAFSACSSYILSSYYVAASLVDVENRIRSFVKLMFDYQQHSHLRLCLPFYQYILNMMGESANPCVLKGDATDLMERLPSPHTDEDIIVVRRVETFATLALAYNFDRPDLMDTLLQDIEKNFGDLRGHYTEHQFSLWVALAHFEMYKYTGKRWHRAKLTRITEQNRKWVAEGVVACHPRYLLLKAVKSSLSKSVAKTEAAFDLAIQACIQSQNLHLQALTSELAARFFINKGNFGLASEFLESAVSLYAKWGCYGKLPYLRRNFQIVLER